jgi:hypothetical protein
MHLLRNPYGSTQKPRRMPYYCGIILWVALTEDKPRTNRGREVPRKPLLRKGHTHWGWTNMRCFANPNSRTCLHLWPPHSAAPPLVRVPSRYVLAMLKHSIGSGPALEGVGRFCVNRRFGLFRARTFAKQNPLGCEKVASHPEPKVLGQQNSGFSILRFDLFRYAPSRSERALAS